METVLQHNDLLVHRVHRHEPPVSALPLTILHQDSDIVAINKPHSIPVSLCSPVSLFFSMATMPSNNISATIIYVYTFSLVDIITCFLPRSILVGGTGTIQLCLFWEKSTI